MNTGKVRETPHSTCAKEGVYTRCDVGRLVSLVDLNVNSRGHLGTRDAKCKKVCSTGCGRGWNKGIIHD